MKKFLYAAVMALTMGFFASCNGGPGTGMKYAEDENPQINYDSGSVNGKTYDNTTDKCWEVKMAVKVPYAGTANTTSYDWCSEFLIVSTAESAIAEWNHQGLAAGYSYKEVSAGNSEDCKDLNPDDYLE